VRLRVTLKKEKKAGGSGHPNLGEKEGSKKGLDIGGDVPTERVRDESHGTSKKTGRNFSNTVKEEKKNQESKQTNQGLSLATAQVVKGHRSERVVWET